MVKVSVVIPAFNAERFIEQALLSVKAQTFNPFNPVETVVVNDGSTDNTPYIARKYADLVVHNPKNEGIGATRKRGSKEATGDHIAFLSADDAYHPYFLELMMREADGKSILFCDFWRCDEFLNPESVTLPPFFKTQKQFRKLVIEWALQQNMFTNFSTIIIPKDVFKKVQFNETLRYGEDLIFLLETVLANIPWKHIGLPLVYYRVHKEAGTYKGWKPEYRKNLWLQLGEILIKLDVPLHKILKAKKQAMTRARRKQRKHKVPTPIIRTYRKLRELTV